MALITVSALMQAPNPWNWEFKRAYFAYLRIEDRAGKLVPLVPMPGQDGLLRFTEMQHRATGRVRLLVLKERQEEGISTLVSALFDEETTRFPHRRAAVASNDSEATAEHWKRVRRFQDYKPRELRLPVRSSTKHEIQYLPPHDSCFRVLSAEDQDMGAGGTLDLFHGTEVARDSWSKAGLLAVLNSLSDADHTYGFLESTGEGAWGVYYDMVMDAIERARRNPTDLTGWQLYFLSWLKNPACVRIPPEEWEERRATESLQALKLLDATRHQLYWRSCVLAEKCMGDEELFKQQYPATPDEAFLHSGARYFPEPCCERLDKMVCEPETYRLVWTAETESGMQAARFDEGMGATLWQVWRPPVRGHDYVLFADVALGMVCDPRDPRSDRDSHAAGVLDRVTMEVVAGLRNRMDLGDLGEELDKCALWYWGAWAAPEAWPGPGIATLERMRTHKYAYRQKQADGTTREAWAMGYPNIYRRERPADALEPAEMQVLGWSTDAKTRPIMMADIKSAFSPNPVHEYDGKIRLYWREAVCEMRSFVLSDTGKPQAQVGTHDDIVMMLAGLVQLHNRCPRQLAVEKDITPRRLAEARYVGQSGDALLRNLKARMARV